MTLKLVLKYVCMHVMTKKKRGRGNATDKARRAEPALAVSLGREYCWSARAAAKSRWKLTHKLVLCTKKFRRWNLRKFSGNVVPLLRSGHHSSALGFLNLRRSLASSI